MDVASFTEGRDGPHHRGRGPAGGRRAECAATSRTSSSTTSAEIDGVPRTRTPRNGLHAGTYVQPVKVWVQREQAVAGTSSSYDFPQMPCLTQGIGFDEDGNLCEPLGSLSLDRVADRPAPMRSLPPARYGADKVDTNSVPSGKPSL
ncbi:hypothetical protein DL769_009662 [Monosporascus sp. CRB-8-3]|nr:hypothetical protein DL769_009662 [Monosporascus sp. CRB-8-3]